MTACSTANEHPDMWHWITEEQAASMTAMSVHWFRKMRCKGGGIVFAKIGTAIRYRRADVVAWMESRQVRSTSETGRQTSSTMESL